jgi:D-glycero-D-manno-heptose 1,7-bisphosphate phosphatase
MSQSRKSIDCADDSDFDTLGAMAIPAVFVDRDGVLIREVNYLRRPEQVRLIRGSAEAVTLLRNAGFKVVVITNQSGVGRGYFTLGDLARAHARLKAALRERGARVDGLYFCPHAPSEGCRCRKPKPFMLKKAARELSLDLKRSYFVGDTTTDLATARAAGCAGVLVRTGKGGRDARYAAVPAAVARDLRAAARWILATLPPRSAAGSRGVRRSRRRSAGR